MEKRVLIIEDESDIRTYLMAVLEDHGFETATLQKNEAALSEFVKSVHPDLILLDVMMPERSGISIYEELRTASDLRDIPVIIISGFSPESQTMPDNFRQLVTNPAIPAPDGFIDKPMDLERLISMIKLTLSMGE